MKKIKDTIKTKGIGYIFNTILLYFLLTLVVVLFVWGFGSEVVDYFHTLKNPTNNVITVEVKESNNDVIKEGETFQIVIK